MFQFLDDAWQEHRTLEHADDDFGEFVKVFIDFLGLEDE